MIKLLPEAINYQTKSKLPPLKLLGRGFPRILPSKQTNKQTKNKNKDHTGKGVERETWSLTGLGGEPYY